MTEFDKDIGAKIRLLRKEHNTNRTIAADLLGISYQQLNKYEIGKSEISAKKLAKLSEYFKVDINYFFYDVFNDDNRAFIYDIAKLTPEQIELVKIFIKQVKR